MCRICVNLHALLLDTCNFTHLGDIAKSLLSTPRADLRLFFRGRCEIRDIKDEVVIWNIYNTIREIENTFRTLKSELDLRPIYHKTDKGTIAHLHLGILAYWIVNTIRHQLKCHDIHHQWNEIVRLGNTQKILTTRGQNTEDEIIEVRRSTEPEEKLAQLLEILKMPPRPFWRKKSVVHKTTPKKVENACLRYLPPG